jgi:hypothetical protein
MNHDLAPSTKHDTRMMDTLSITTSESFSDNSKIQNPGFRYISNVSTPTRTFQNIENFQVTKDSDHLHTSPCTYKNLQDFFRAENNKMCMEEFYTHFINDSPMKNLVFNIEQNVRQQFIQMIPNLLKSTEFKFLSESNQKEDSINKKINPLPKVEKDESITLKMLSPLSIYLSKLLKGEQICESELDLSFVEKVILASIINKKYKHKSIKRIDKISDMTPKFLLEFPQNISQGVSLKRTEENYKIVFNWCFKFLKKKLADGIANEKKKPLCKKELEDFFYRYYFSKVVEEKGLNISKFYKPNFTNKLQNVEKTFNTHFISHIQMSDLFMNDFSLALSSFVSTHLDLIDKKLKSLFFKWEEMLSADSNNEEALKTISNYIMKSSKCKLPWSRKEVEVAHRIVTNLFK